MQRSNFPASPVVLLIMGPMAESKLRRSLALSSGSYDFLYTRPITAGLLIVAAITLMPADPGNPQAMSPASPGTFKNTMCFTAQHVQTNPLSRN